VLEGHGWIEDGGGSGDAGGDKGRAARCEEEEEARGHALTLSCYYMYISLTISLY
jgi:hypothetical protein